MTKVNVFIVDTTMKMPNFSVPGTESKVPKEKEDPSTTRGARAWRDICPTVIDVEDNLKTNKRKPKRFNPTLIHILKTSHTK
ncbi:hypothetical protein SFRURICE_005074 [Spodoptera frugiperda]|nr:hypothetical protein SFRURICE_005074 [Spodoptera frugiperda]